MNYQELVDKCKSAYANKDLKLAWELWEKLNTIVDKLETIDIADDKGKKAVWEEYHSYMGQFTNEEVYGITDYGKQKAYREMELDKIKSILDKSYKLVDLTKNDKMKSLDEFLEFYEWCVVASDEDENKYYLYDLQTKEIKDDESKILNDIISRVVERAIDYEITEHEIEDEDLTDDYFEYLENLYDISKEYNYEDNYMKDYINELKEEKERLGLDDKF